MKSGTSSVLIVSFSLGGALVLNSTHSACAADEWIISETTSPVDYSPVVVVTTRSRENSESTAMELSIYCRNNHTYLVLVGQGISGRASDYAISYRINGNKPTQAGVGSALYGGVAAQGDVASLLQSLPDEGEIAIRLAARTGPSREGHFSLAGLKAVRNKLAAACKWLPARIKPTN
jgi:hypothetical protein